MLSAQSTPPRGPQCFSIRVRPNGVPVDGPQVITLKTNQSESTASLERTVSTVGFSVTSV
jgi:hypothetical protein